MALTASSRIGPYEVIAPLGAGGMGEVYRARDTQLKREVALKVLPDTFARDAERVARFRREAELLASLNHPHIASVYGLERSDAATAIVLELVEGDTLSEIIARGAMPIADALPIARQIAEALEAAHERGVIHRDLKPANIKLTADGRVKVLDFGLAKMMADEGGQLSADALSMSPTLATPAGTFAGTILGTAAYMAPEQAKGAAVDRRADLFAFGCVLFEMLTGRPAFEGGAVTEILANVLKSDPGWEALPPQTPPAVRRLLRRCLQKDRQQRLQSAGDARLELTEAVSGNDVVAPASTATPASRARWLWPAATGVLAIALVALAAYLLLRAVPAPRELRLDVTTTGAIDLYSFALSPDGRSIVYQAPGDDDQPRLWVRSLNSTEARALPGTEGGNRPFWSPDSRSIGFFALGGLKRIDVDGGSPQTVATVFGARGAAWGASGVILYSGSVTGPLLQVPASGGQPVPATTLVAQHLSHRFPHFLPDGRRFLFFNQGSDETRGVYLGTLDSPDVTLVVRADTAAAFLPPNRLVFVRNSTLLAQDFDADGAKVLGEPRTIANGIEGDAGNSLGAFSTSRTGLIAYRAGGAAARQLTWFDRSGKTLGTWGPVEPNLMNVEIAPDGRRVLVDRSLQNNVDVWVVDALRAARLTFDARQDHWAIWSPDGSRVVFDSDRSGSHDLYERASDGGGAETPLLLTKDSKGIQDWSRDGRVMVFTTATAGNAFDIWILPRDGDKKPALFLGTPADERDAQFSPDDRWLAYASNESGRYEIFVRPFPGPGGQLAVSTAGGIAPRWRHDGREILYIAPDGTIVAAPITVKGGSIEAGTPVALFRPRIAFGGTPTAKFQYDVASDGRLLVNTIAGDAPSPPITLLVNWNLPNAP